MGMPGMTEMIIILVIILIIFGAGKLPEIGSGLGRAIKNFKKGVSDSGSTSDDDKTADSGDSNEELKSKDDSESKD